MFKTGQLTFDDYEDINKVGRSKEYKISEINKLYLKSFQEFKYPDITTNKKQGLSYLQYKCTISNFLESLNKDVAMCKREDIDSFIGKFSNESTRKNKSAHIKSFMTFLITENIKNCTTKIGRDCLIKLMQM